MRFDGSDVLIIVGVTLLLGGIWLIAPPWAIALGGLAIIWVGAALGLRR